MSLVVALKSLPSKYRQQISLLPSHSQNYLRLFSRALENKRVKYLKNESKLESVTKPSQKSNKTRIKEQRAENDSSEITKYNYIKLHVLLFKVNGHFLLWFKTTNYFYTSFYVFRNTLCWNMFNLAQFWQKWRHDWNPATLETKPKYISSKELIIFF